MTTRIPEGFHTVTPSIISKNAAAAIELYTKALGAKEEYRMPNSQNGKIMHACIIIGNSKVFIYDENPQMKSFAPSTQGSNVNFYIYVDDVDAAYKKALAAGLKEAMPVTEMFWGDRIGAVTDTDGYRWTLATHVRDVTSADMEKGMKQMCNQAA